MQTLFDFVHLDPSQDPPEVYGAAFDLLCERWTQLRAFRSSCRNEEFLVQLTACIEKQVVAAGFGQRRRTSIAYAGPRNRSGQPRSSAASSRNFEVAV